MAAYDLEEQEQLDEIKAWWKMHGNKIINVVTVAALCIAGWQGWNWYQNKQTAQASAIFGMLQSAVQEKNIQAIKATNGELLDKFGGTSYAALSALASAKAMIDSGDMDTAKLQLSWLTENGKDEMRDIARLRLATLLLDEKKYDDAIKVLDGDLMSAFAARFADLRGDILVASGKKSEAAKAYQEAVQKLADAQTPEARFGQTGAIYRELLRQKLDSVSGE